MGEAKNKQTMKVDTTHCGKTTIEIEGDLSAKDYKPVFLTIHDIGGHAKDFYRLCHEPIMSEVMEKSIWIHLVVPGQELNAPDWPQNTPYPTLDAIATDITEILDAVGVKYVIGVGWGAGANIIARFAMKSPSRILGFVAVHPTSTTAGIREVLKDKWMSWKLRSVGMNPTVEQYLVFYRYGSQIDESNEKDHLVQQYVKELEQKANPKNLERYMNAFLKRSDLSDQLKTKMNCDTLVVTGTKSSFLHTNQTFYEHCNPQKTSFLRVDDVGDVAFQAPATLAKSMILFVKGCGVLTSVSIPGIERQRSFSSGEGRGAHPTMSEADDPAYYSRRSSQASVQTCRLVRDVRHR